MEQDHEEPQDAFDPAWVSLDGVDPWELPEVLSGIFDERAASAPEGSSARCAHVAMAVATSAMLDAGNWETPFEPASVIAGRRSAVPGDLTPGQFVLLRAALPHVVHGALHARLADVLWINGLRSDSETLLEAVSAYLAAPLEGEVWAGFGRDAWRRALMLLQRRGASQRVRLADAVDTMRKRMLAGAVADGFMLVELSDLVVEFGRTLLAEDRAVMGERLVELASEAARSNRRLAVALEERAAGWFHGCRRHDAAHEAMVRVAELHVAAARDQAAGDGAMAAGVFLEDALKVLLQLPQRFRQTHGQDELIETLRKELRSSRLASLDQMQTFESDPVDLTDAVRDAERQVTGKQSLAALVAVALIANLADARSMDTDARARLVGSISRLFSGHVLSGDGRKLASVQGSAGEPSEVEITAQMSRDFEIFVGLMVQGRILPAREVLIGEHLMDRGFLAAVCHESPVIPAGHEGLWAGALLHGMTGDFGTAVAVLAPQLEHLVRAHLKGAGVHTLSTDESSGVEKEKPLGVLLGMPEAVDVLGGDLVLTLRLLLVTPGGLNLRNDVAHGLLTDSQGRSEGAVYVWWLCLRLAVPPVWRRRLPPQEPAGDVARPETDGATVEVRVPM